MYSVMNHPLSVSLVHRMSLIIHISFAGLITLQMIIKTRKVEPVSACMSISFKY